MRSKKEIRAALRRFEADPGRVISIKLFCEVAGIGLQTYKDIRAGAYDMGPTTQRRLELALDRLERGEIKIMRRPDKTHYVTYRKTPEPQMRRGLALTMRGGRIGLRMGIENANAYGRTTFKEEFDGNS